MEKTEESEDCEMALKQVVLSRRIADQRAALAPLKEKRDALAQRRAGMETREAELEAAVNEITDETSQEDRDALDAEISAFETETEALKQEEQANADAIAGIESAIEALQGELDEINRKAEPPANPNPQAPAETEERSMNHMEKRINIPGMTLRERVAGIATREDVKDFATRMRGLIGQKRAVSGAEVTIPEVVLPMIRELVETSSKLLKYVNLQRVTGKLRQTIMATIPEAVWTEMCGRLNELDLGVNDAEVDGYKVGSFVAICNALKEDNDVELVTQIIFAMGRAEALAVDKAILYGTGTKMPLGIVPRLAQTEAPSDARDTDRPWIDLHSTNIVKITAANSTGIKLFQSIMQAFGKAKKKYGADGKFFAMNENTHMTLTSEALSINAAGAIVSGVNGTMPVIGGDIVELDFLPDNVIIAGYGSNYLMAERAGRVVAQSEEARFIEDQTVFKCTARYDGEPVIPESFVAIGINNTDVPASVTFRGDGANEPDAVWLPATASVKANETITLKPMLTPYGVETTYTWASGTAAKATVAGGVVTGVAAGTSVITVTTANGLTAQCTVTVTAD